MNCICGNKGEFNGLCEDHVRFAPLDVRGFPEIGRKFVSCAIRGVEEPKESAAFLRLYRESALGCEDLSRLVKNRWQKEKTKQ